MGKKIIVLDRDTSSTQTPSYRVAFWADVPVTRQAFYALIAPTKSAWKDAAAAEITAITTGAVVERVESISVPPGAILSDIQLILTNRFNDYQTFITNINPWLRYGSFWDGVSWTAGGVV